uniref:Metalloendopeptidase n=1 Tax=Globodera rostochiensis TaxID=31243 RepID=A0A914GYW5_GLORO
MILLTFWLLLIALKTFDAHGGEPPDKIWNMCENDLVTLDKHCQTRLICYQSKLAKDSGNWKVGGRFRVNNPNGSIAYECAENDGAKGWQAVRISNDNAGTLTLDDQSVEADFWKSIRFGAFMRDFNGMAFQLAALEIRQFIGKKDMKLCKTKCAAKWESQTKMPKYSSTTNRTSTATMLSPVMPKAQHINHLGINCVQIEFPMEIAKFSLNISTSSYWIACAVHRRDDKADHVQDNHTKITEVANKDHFNACSKVPTSSVCDKSLELYACYKSIKNQTQINKEIAETCQKHLNQASFVAGFRLRICMQREVEKQMLAFETSLDLSSSEQMIKTTKKFPIKFGEVSELMEFVPFSFFEFGHQPSEKQKANATGTVLDSIFNEQINGSWTKTVHFVPPLNENMEIYFQISRPGFTKLITRQTNLLPYRDNPNKTRLSKCDRLGDECEPIRQIMSKINEMREWCAPFNPSGPCIDPRRAPTPEDLKPFMRPPWDRMAFPSTEVPPNDKRTNDPLEDGEDVLYTKEQVQSEYDYLVKVCAKCRNSSTLEKEPQRQKRQYLIWAIKWEEFPIPIRFDLKSFGKEIESARAAIKGAVTWIMENTCVNFTFDKSNATQGIQITSDYVNAGDYCGLSGVGRGGGWQELTLNCRDMGTAVHELLHALGLTHEHQRNDVYSFIKLNPFETDNAKKTENYGLPYDFGSIIHYPPEQGSYNTYKRITLNRFYQQTIGQKEKPSFKDYAIINRMYCNDSCSAENLCQNGGYPNPKRCSECFCPDGYGGKRCETLEEDSNCASLGVHSTRELEADWQIRTFNPSVKCVGDYECACHWRIKPKDGKKLRIQLKQLDLQAQCSAAISCNRPFFEIKFRKDKRAQGARLCCPDAIRQMSPSQNWIETEEPGTEMIISAHLNGMNNVTIELTYETDGAKIVRSDECPDPRDLFIKERNPGQPVTCNVDDLKGKKIPCSRKNEIYACRLANYTALVNGRPTNKTQIFIECFKREDNPTKFWGYWEDKAQDPIHIDDIQCSPVRERNTARDFAGSRSAIAHFLRSASLIEK